MGMSAEQIKVYNSLTEERAALSHLMGSGGWKYLEEHCEKTAAFAYELQATTDNPTVMAKQVGAWHVAKSILGYPAYRLRQIEAQIRLMEAPQKP